MSQFGCVVKRLDLPPHAGVEKNKPVGVLTLMDVVCCSDPEVETAVGNYLLDAVSIPSFHACICQCLSGPYSAEPVSDAYCPRHSPQCSYERVGLVESYDEGQAVAHGANSCVIKAWMPDGQSFWRKGQTDVGPSSPANRSAFQQLHGICGPGYRDCRVGLPCFD